MKVESRISSSSRRIQYSSVVDSVISSILDTEIQELTSCCIAETTSETVTCSNYALLSDNLEIVSNHERRATSIKRFESNYSETTTNEELRMEKRQCLFKKGSENEFMNEKIESVSNLKSESDYLEISYCLRLNLRIRKSFKSLLLMSIKFYHALEVRYDRMTW
jgi:hypothetical protein